VTIYRIRCPSPTVKKSEKLILDRHPDPDQHQKLTTSGWSFLAYACHLWSTSVNAFVSYPAHSQKERSSNDKMTERTII